MIYVNVEGDEVPALGLGTWELEGDTCREAVTHALDVGYRHVDTAQSYENETEVGQGLRDSDVDREEIFLTTKLWRTAHEPKLVRRTAEESLGRLGTDYVDLLLIHWPNDEVPLEKTLDAMMTLQEEGKARHLGVSNFPPSLLERAVAHAPVVCNQVEYHPFLGQEALHDLARKHDLMLTAYSPIARGAATEDDTLREIAEAHGKSTAQVSLRWLVQQDRVAAIPKSTSAEHRAANFDIFDFALTEAEMARIHGLARGERLVDPGGWVDWER